MHILPLVFALLLQSPPPFPVFPLPDPLFPAVTLSEQCKVTLGDSASVIFGWSQLYGPAPAGISNPDASITKLTLITPGLYVFRCTVMNGPLSTFADYYIQAGGSYKQVKPPDNGLAAVIVEVPFGPPLDKINPVITSVRLTTTLADVSTNTLVIPSLTTSLSFTVVATDNTAVMMATFYVDDYQADVINTLGTGLPPTFFVRWNEKAIKLGVHQFLLRIFDAAGNFAEKRWSMKR